MDAGRFHTKDNRLRLELSQAEFAQAVEVPPDRLVAVIHGEQPVIADLALLFAQAFDQSPHYWLNLQAEYDLAMASINIGAQLKRVHRVAEIPHNPFDRIF